MAIMLKLSIVILAIWGCMGRGIDLDNKCGDAAQWLPCKCVEIDEYSLAKLRCYHVKSLDELDTMFSRNLPIRTFSSMYIRDGRFTTLSNIFHGTRFSVVRMDDMAELQSVAPDTFADSVKHLQKLSFHNAGKLDVRKFPFTAFESYLYKIELELVGLKPGTGLPVISAANIEISLQNFTIGEPLPEGFMMNSKEHRPMLVNLGISYLPKNAFKLGNKDLYLLFLSHNKLSSFDPDAFVVNEPGSISLVFDYNNFTKISQDSFEKLFAAMTLGSANQYGFDIVGNPLECGCDLAWIFRNDKYQQILQNSIGSRVTKCANGRPITDLKKSEFINCP